MILHSLNHSHDSVRWYFMTQKFLERFKVDNEILLIIKCVYALTNNVNSNIWLNYTAQCILRIFVLCVCPLHVLPIPECVKGVNEKPQIEINFLKRAPTQVSLTKILHFLTTSMRYMPLVVCLTVIVLPSLWKITIILQRYFVAKQSRCTLNGSNNSGNSKMNNT